MSKKTILTPFLINSLFKFRFQRIQFSQITQMSLQIDIFSTTKTFRLKTFSLLSRIGFPLYFSVLHQQINTAFLTSLNLVTHTKFRREHGRFSNGQMILKTCFRMKISKTSIKLYKTGRKLWTVANCLALTAQLRITNVSVRLPCHKTITNRTKTTIPTQKRIYGTNGEK